MIKMLVFDKKNSQKMRNDLEHINVDFSKEMEDVRIGHLQMETAHFQSGFLEH